MAGCSLSRNQIRGISHTKHHTGLALLVILMISTSGCVTVVGNYRPETSDINEPPLGVVTTVYIGDTMLRQGRLTLHDAILLREDVDVGLLGLYTLRRGYYLRIGEDAESEFYQPSRSESGGAVVKAAPSPPPKTVPTYKTHRRVFVVAIFKPPTFTTQAEVEPGKPPTTTPKFLPPKLI